MTNAYGYVRVSGEGQITGHGLERQREIIERYAAGHDLNLIRVFVEPGTTGTITDRPALGDLLLAIERNGVRHVVVESLDRLARDLVVQEAIAENFKRQGVDLISATQGDDLASDDPGRKLIRQLLGAIAEYDKSMTVLRLAAARRAKRKANGGKCEGRKAYGECDPKERAAIARCKELRAKTVGKGRGKRQLSMTEIAKVMNQEGYPTRQGRPWTAQTVRSVLRK